MPVFSSTSVFGRMYRMGGTHRIKPRLFVQALLTCQMRQIIQIRLICLRISNISVLENVSRGLGWPLWQPYLNPLMFHLNLAENRKKSVELQKKKKKTSENKDGICPELGGWRDEGGRLRYKFRPKIRSPKSWKCTFFSPKHSWYIWSTIGYCFDFPID